MADDPKKRRPHSEPSPSQSERTKVPGVTEDSKDDLDLGENWLKAVDDWDSHLDLATEPSPPPASPSSSPSPSVGEPSQAPILLDKRKPSRRRITEQDLTPVPESE